MTARGPANSKKLPFVSPPGNLVGKRCLSLTVARSLFVSQTTDDEACGTVKELILFPKFQAGGSNDCKASQGKSRWVRRNIYSEMHIYSWHIHTIKKKNRYKMAAIRCTTAITIIISVATFTYHKGRHVLPRNAILCADLTQAGTIELVQ
ncbi:hypothetical protein SK128_020172 [Halocaridina rubra]|uniref:Uncharacterized protein n=1 Tax=Halocaridina rubra TaxID=373956 RepID=A0AAN8WJU8_HALRR